MTAPIAQLSLFDEAIRPTIRVEHHATTIKEQFQEFHQANPHVAQALAEMAFALRNRGHDHFGMKALFEALRFQYALQTNDPNSEFRLNNNYTALYARYLMKKYPELEGFFETRQRRSQ